MNWIAKHLTTQAVKHKEKQDLEKIDEKIGHTRKKFIAKAMKEGHGVDQAIAKWDKEQNEVVVE